MAWRKTAVTPLLMHWVNTILGWTININNLFAEREQLIGIVDNKPALEMCPPYHRITQHGWANTARGQWTPPVRHMELHLWYHAGLHIFPLPDTK